MRERLEVRGDYRVATAANCCYCSSPLPYERRVRDALNDRSVRNVFRHWLKEEEYTLNNISISLTETCSGGGFLSAAIALSPSVVQKRERERVYYRKPKGIESERKRESP